MSDRTDIEIPNTGLLPETQVEDHAPEADRLVNPRDAIMARIAANAQAEREREMAQSAVYDQDARDAGLAFQDDEPVEAAPQALPASPVEADRRDVIPPSKPETAPAYTAPQTFPVDVDGQTLYVTQDQLVHLARMGAVANREIHRWQTGQIQQPHPAQSFAAPVAEPPRPIVDQTRIRETVKQIQYGNETDASEALASLIHDVVQRTPAPQQIDPVAITNAAVAQARAVARLEADTQVIRQEYADVMNDPWLADMAAKRVAILRQENAALGRNVSDLDIYREAGNFVLDKMNRPRPGQVAHSATAEQTAPQAPIVVRRSADVDARKRAAPRSLSQVIDRRSPAPETPRPPSGSDIVELMRKQRFQTSMR